MKLNLRKYMMTFFYPFLLAVPITPPMDWIEKYLWGDWEFLDWLIILIVIDTTTSIWYHFRKKDLSSEGFSRLPIKLIVYSILLICANILCSFQIQGDTQEQYTLFRTLVCNALMIRETASIFENITKIDPNLIPVQIRKFMAKFDNESGQLES